MHEIGGSSRGLVDGRSMSGAATDVLPPGTDMEEVNSMKKAIHGVIIGLAIISITACASNESNGHDDHAMSYGHVGPVVVELYDVVANDGMIELELHRDGRIFEAEADVPLERLPAHVREAAMTRAGAGAVVTGAEIEYGARGRTYEVKFDRAGQGLEYVLDESGRILEEERELDRSQAPAGVVENAMRSIPGAFKSVEILEMGNEAVYHVKTVDGAAHYKAVVDPSGRVLRAVREAKAEIEIPLR